MMFLDKAQLIETLDGYKLRSQAMEIPVPSVIRLDYYIRVPIKRVMLTRKNVIKRDGGRCQYCGQKKSQMTVDHIIPKRHRGADTWENLVCACHECNNMKGHRLPEQAGLKLLRNRAGPTTLPLSSSMWDRRIIDGVPICSWINTRSTRATREIVNPSRRSLFNLRSDNRILVVLKY